MFSLQSGFMFLLAAGLGGWGWICHQSGNALCALLYPVAGLGLFFGLVSVQESIRLYRLHRVEEALENERMIRPHL